MAAKSERYERYIPEKDLPEEIQQLPHEEIRCRFCGVSYLVHHEVKKLEEIVKELQSKLQEAEDTTRTQSELAEKEIARVRRLKDEIEVLKARLQSKEGTVHQSLQLLQSTQAQLQQFKDICDNLKSHFFTTVNDIDNDFQLLKNYFNSKLTELYAEKANLQQALFSAKKNYKVAELSLKEETMKREEELRKREEIIENVNLEQSKLVARCQEVETELSRTTQKLVMSDSQLMQTRQELKTTQQDKETLRSQLEKKTSECSENLKQLHNLRKKFEETNAGYKSELDQLHRQHEAIIHTHSGCQKQLFEKDQELASMRMKVEREKQELYQRKLYLEQQVTKAKEDMAFQTDHYNVKITKMKDLLKSEHNETVKKLKSVWENEKTKVLEIEREHHMSVLNQCKTNYETKIKKLEETLQHMKESYDLKINELEKCLLQEKHTFDAEVMRHVSQEKELQLTIEQYQTELSQCQKTLSENITKLENYKSNTMSDKEQMETALKSEKQKWQQKLDEAYTEIANLQSIIEKQVNERQELIERYTTHT